MKAEDLKNSILQLAMEGKLVPQNPNDEPASVLLDKIREEKEQLINEKKIKRNNKESFIFRNTKGHFYEKVGKKGEPICIDDELPFEIPDNWEIMRLDDIGVYKKGPFGSALKKSLFVPKSEDTIKVYEQKNAIQKNSTLGEYYITKEYYQSKMKGFTVESGDIIVSCAGTIGETYVLPECIELGIINQALMRMNIVPSIYLDYFLIYFDYILKKSAIEYSKGSAIKNIPPFKIFKRLIFPLPPIDEQKRIVNKIEEFLPLIKLRSSILQEAIKGKLVPQNSNDEPASVLLEKIRDEKERLIKEKKIKRNKNESFIYKMDNHFYEKIGDNEPVCIDDEIPFDIPDSWAWVRLDSVCKYIQRGKSPKYSEIKKFPVVAQKCNQWSGFSLEKAKFIDPKTVDSYNEERILQNKDIMWNSTGLGTLGRVGLYDESVNKYGWAVADSHVTIIRPFAEYILQEFIYLFLASPTVQLVIESKAGGSTKQKELNLSTIKNYLIPLAPYNEQKNIIEKVHNLNKLIE